VIDERDRVLARTRRHLEEWLIPGAVLAESEGRVTAWAAPGEPVPFAEAVAGRFEPVAPGAAWGAAWSTWWFRVEVDAPETPSGADLELELDLGFTHTRPGFQCEGTVWTEDGRLERAVEPMNRILPVRAAAGERVVRYVEAAANPSLLFAPEDPTGSTLTSRPTPLGDRLTAGPEPLYRLGTIALRTVDRETAELVADVRFLLDLAAGLEPGSARSADIVAALRRMLAASDLADVRGTASAARACLRPALEATGPHPRHSIVAVGHAHIDSAWLWPTRETRRKAARTFANALAMMDLDPDFVFAASSAQQYAWVEEDHPELFERIRARVAEGRFIPVGGMWVESDTILPSGESLVRQLVEGTRYFLERFGVETSEVWLPDSFGYSASLPQIAAHAGKTRMLAQKLSWNDTDRMPHTSFWWEGPDGARLFTHMPSVDIYESDLRVADLLRSERQYADKGRGRTAMVPFGYGDGGGGPTREMLGRAARSRDVDGLPELRLGSPDEVFATAQAELAQPAVWTGELYLQFHRGIYTSQQAMKRGNRASERLLQQAEAVSAAATLLAGAPYPAERLREIWRTVLLGQFHDILPGSSIAWVHREMRDAYAAIELELADLLARGRHALGAVAAAPGVGSPEVATPTSLREDADGWTLANGLLTAHVDRRGVVDSLVDSTTGREVVAPGGALGRLQLHDDVAAVYEAWELDPQYTDTEHPIEAVESLSAGSGEAAGSAWVEVARSVGGSTAVVRFVLRPEATALDIEVDVDWHERRRILKLAHDLDVVAEHADYEVQLGSISRPIVENTSWDEARFEVPALRWVHVGEPGFGIAVANDAITGHDVHRRPRTGGGAMVVLRQSLLRAPRFPDPETDQGRHRFRTAVRPGAGRVEAKAEADRLAAHPAEAGLEARGLLVTLDRPEVEITAVKLADDGSGDLVVRLAEWTGSRVRCSLQLAAPMRAAERVDALERPTGAPLPLSSATTLGLDLRPFELTTLRLTPA
jgi:alpha-mannosidase